MQYKMEDIFELKDRYQNGRDNIGIDLIRPCLSLCNHYRRGTGFFSSSALKAYSASLGDILCNDVKIDILTSPIIQDKKLLKVLESNATPEQKTNTIQELAEQIVLTAVGFKLNPKNIGYRSKLLAYLIANEQLEVRFAIPKDFDWPTEDNINENNIYHVKMGYFQFPDGASVAFDGSFNESDSGHSHHVDRTQVYRSWINDDTKRLKGVVEDVDNDWNGKNEYIAVYPLSKNSIEIIKKLSPSTRPRNNHKDKRKVHKPNTVTIKTTNKVEFPNNIWPHKKEAVLTFLEKKFGILEMATGTGKTSTALEIARQLYLTYKINTIIISTYGNDLLDQWHQEIVSWKLNTENSKIKNIKVFINYDTTNEMQAFLNNLDNSILIVSREPDRLKNLFISKRLIKSQTLIIHDEIHGFGSPKMAEKLSGSHADFAYRLGLSATPEREYDEEGTSFITSEIGPTIFEFPLEDAIRSGILCEFDYICIGFQLTQNDKDNRKKVYSRKARAEKDGKPWTKERLYIELSKVVKKAEAKPALLHEFLSKNQSAIQSSIIFVLDKEQGDTICNVVSEFTHKYKTYYAGTENVYLSKLANGQLDTLVACERLNEGIDIKSLQNVFLIASPKSKLDTIQRIGRCLRKDPNEPIKRALVIDFVLKDDDSEKDTTDTQRQTWLESISKVKQV